MTINLKNFLNDKRKMSKMGEFQELKTIDGLEISSVSADLYQNGRDDVTLFYFKEGANYASLQTTNSVISESLFWNQKSNKKSIKALIVNTKNANTFTGKEGLESLDEIAKTKAKIVREETTVITGWEKNYHKHIPRCKNIFHAKTVGDWIKICIECLDLSIKPIIDPIPGR